jgi:fido (protein-threonine AMPylation protein)
MNTSESQFHLTPGVIDTLIRGNGSTHKSASSHILPAGLPQMIVRTFPYTISIPESKYSDQRVFVTGSDELYIYDGIHHVRAILLDKDCCLSDAYHSLKTSSMFIRIHGYITSQANLNQEEPVLCLSKIEILHIIPISNAAVFRADRSIIGTRLFGAYAVPGEAYRLSEGRVMGGKIVDFLSNVAPFLSYDALSGCHKEEPTPFGMTLPRNAESTNDSLEEMLASNRNNWVEMNKKLQDVASFLSKHQAYVSWINSTNSSEATELPTPFSVHKMALESFSSMQMDLQKAALLSNVRRAQASESAQIVQQHQEVLQQIIQNKHPWLNPTTDDINLTMLNWCHAKLCGGDLVPDAGKLRNKTVRVGTTSFVHSGAIEPTVLQLLSSLEVMRNRWMSQLHHRVHHGFGATTYVQATKTRGASPQSPRRADTSSPRPSSDQKQLLASFTYVAAVFMGILDTHPYSDGNGRLSRLVVNWILYHQIRFPFVVNFFTTPTQRLEYSNAICRTRQNISLVHYGVAPDDVFLEAYERVGALFPMVELVLDRLHKSVTEFNSMAADKMLSCSEHQQTRAARTFRERAASGTCQICFENEPNIATLCCGNAVHMNCIARWLSNNSSCPQCRSVIPQLPRSILSVSESSDEAGHVSVPHHMFTHILRVYESAQGNADTESVEIADTEDIDDDETVSAAETVPVPSRGTYCAHCHVNLAALDCSNSLCGRCCNGYGQEYCARHSA